MNESQTTEIRAAIRATGLGPHKTRGGPHLHGWLARRAEIVDAWRIAIRRGYPWRTLSQPGAPARPLPCPLPLSVADEAAADAFGRSARPRKKYWAWDGARVSASRALGAPEVREEPRDVSSSYGPWQATAYRVVVPARIVRGSMSNAIVTAWDFEADQLVRRRIRAPRGYVLGQDDEGVYLARQGHHTDHLARQGHTVHLDSGCWRPGALRAAAAKWRQLETYRAAARRLAAEALDRAGLRIPRSARRAPVTLADAEQVGLCRAGTVAWCRARGIPTRGASLDALTPYVGDERVARVVRRVLARATA